MFKRKTANKNKFQLSKDRKIFWSLLMTTTVVIAGVAVAVVTGGEESAEAASSQIQANIQATGYYVNVKAADFVSLNVDAEPNGAYAAVKDTVNVKTNAPSGYKLYVGSDREGDDGNKLYLNGKTDSSSFLNATGGTGTNPASLSDNSWGFAIPGKGGFDSSYAVPSPGSSSKWAGMPLKGQEFLIDQENAATGSEGKNLDVYYGAKANMAIPSGMYRGTVSYSTLASPKGMDQISVFPNVITPKSDGSNPSIKINTGLMTSMNVNMDEVEVRVGGVHSCEITNITKDINGYLVIECDIPNFIAKKPGKKSVAIDNLKFGQYVTLQEAIEFRYDEPFQGINYLQDMTPEICAAEPIPPEYGVEISYLLEKVLYDKRDNKGYVVRKLADGNCWMMQNLALSPDGRTTYTEEDTDLHDGRTFKAPAANAENDAGWNSGGVNGPHYLKPKAGYEYYFGNLHSSTSNPINSAGNYYDWPMTTAGARDVSGNSLISAETGEAADSICPKGWRLPPNSGDKSYSNLFTAYGNNLSDSLLNPPLQFVRAGFVHSGSVRFQSLGIDGFLWSSTVSNNSTAYGMHFRNNNIDFNDVFKGYAISVRCVAR